MFRRHGAAHKDFMAAFGQEHFCCPEGCSHSVRKEPTMPVASSATGPTNTQFSGILTVDHGNPEAPQPAVPTEVPAPEPVETPAPLPEAPPMTDPTPAPTGPVALVA
jgi:hypothetical protein